MIGEDGANELGSELEKLKKAVENSGLEEIAEEEGAEEENLAPIKEVDESALKESVLEPENNLS